LLIDNEVAAAVLLMKDCIAAQEHAFAGVRASSVSAVGANWLQPRMRVVAIRPHDLAPKCKSPGGRLFAVAQSCRSDWRVRAQPRSTGEMLVLSLSGLTLVGTLRGRVLLAALLKGA
jgi:hypothetical protein